MHWPPGSGPFNQFAGGGFSRCWVTCWHGPGLLGLRPPPLTVSGPSAHRERIIEIGRSPLYLFDLWKTPPIAILLKDSQAQSGTTPRHNQKCEHIIATRCKKEKRLTRVSLAKGVVGGGGSCVSGRRSDNGVARSTRGRAGGNQGARERTGVKARVGAGGRMSEEGNEGGKG